MRGWRYLRTSIRTRLAASVLLVLLFVFIVVAVSFNTIVNSYIETRARSQLDEARTHVNRDVEMPWTKPPEMSEEFSGTMLQISGAARRAVFIAQVQVMVSTSSYELAFPTPVDDAPDEAAKMQAVLNGMHAYSVDLTSGEMQRLALPEGVFYVASQPFQGEPGAQDTGDGQAYLVLYTDMTDVAALANTINSVLMLIILATAAVSGVMIVVLSGRIVKPIRALSHFAEAIGRNDFTRSSIKVRDKELIELLHAMNHAAEQLANYDQEQKTFFQNVSHELRTPLMSIKGYAEGIEVGVFEENGQAARVIVQEADHLTDLVEDLLYLSRVDSITKSAIPVTCDVRELLSNCAQSLQGIALSNHKHITYDFPDDPILVDCDERHLMRALSNILANGLRYAQDTLCLRCRAEDGSAYIAITDDGPGIAEADLPHLFERFYKGRGGKHGIGLSIAQAVVRQHGGEITASNAGTGAMFVVRLPIK